MSQLILPKLAPPQNGAQTPVSASDEKVPGTASGQPFEDFLDAKRGSVGGQLNESDQPAGQAGTEGKAKSAAKGAVPNEMPVTATKISTPPAQAPMSAELISPAKEPAPHCNSIQQDASVTPAVVFQAASIQAVTPPQVLKSERDVGAVTNSVSKTERHPATISSASPITSDPVAPLPVAASVAPMKAPARRAPAPSGTASAIPAGTDSLPVVPAVPVPVLSPVQSTISLSTIPIPPQAPPASTSVPFPGLLIAPGATVNAAQVVNPSKTEQADPRKLLPSMAPAAEIAAKAQSEPPVDPLTNAREQARAVVPVVNSSTSAIRASGSEWPGEKTKVKAAEFASSTQGSTAKTGGKAASPGLSSPGEMLSEEAAPTGTAIAKQNPAMSNAAQLPVLESFLRADAPGAASATQAAQPATTKSVSVPQGHDPQQPSAPVAPAVTFSISSSAMFTARTPSVNAPVPMTGQSAATTALNRVMESADKMTSDGTTHVQIQVNLGDGQQLTVRLQMSQGSVHPIFKTESTELRQAIEQNWSGFRTEANERGLQIATPVFETPAGEGGFNAFGNHHQSQQPDGDPSDAQAGHAAKPSPLRTATNQPLTTPVTPAPVGSSVQMYA